MLEGIQYLFPNDTFDVLSDSNTVPDIVKAANDSDLFMLGGGELIRENEIFLRKPHWDREITVPKVVFGCGVNSPNQHLSSEVEESLKTWQYIGLRDEASYQALLPRLPNVHLCLDPSIILTEKRQIRSILENYAVIIPTERKSRQYDPGINSTSIFEDTLPALKADLSKEQFDRVHILDFRGDDNDDAATCQRLMDDFAHLNGHIYVSGSPLEALWSMALCRKAYTYRLHGMIFAWMLGMPFKPFLYHSKIQRVYETLAAFTLKQAVENLKENVKLVSEVS